MFIYALVDPRTHLMAYIGKTKNPKGRFAGHKSYAKLNKRWPVCRWIRKLSRMGLEPTFRIIEECNGLGAAEEIYHIALAKRDGLKLYNCTDGGEGTLGFSHKWTEEQKLASSIRQKGRVIPQSTRELLSRTLTGRTIQTTESRKAISLAHKGRPKSPEHRKKLAAICRKATDSRTKDSFARMAESLRGRKLSVDHVWSLRKLNFMEELTAVDLYNQGFSARKVGKRFDVSRCVIDGVLKRHGVKKRPAAHLRR